MCWQPDQVSIIEETLTKYYHLLVLVIYSCETCTVYVQKIDQRSKRRKNHWQLHFYGWKFIVTGCIENESEIQVIHKNMYNVVSHKKFFCWFNMEKMMTFTCSKKLMWEHSTQAKTTHSILKAVNKWNTKPVQTCSLSKHTWGLLLITEKNGNGQQLLIKSKVNQNYFYYEQRKAVETQHTYTRQSPYDADCSYICVHSTHLGTLYWIH